MDQSANIAAGMKQIFTAAPINALVPGGLIYGLVKAGTESPYASIEVDLARAGNGQPMTEWLTGANYVERYQLNIKVWGDQLVGDAGAIQAALYALLKPSTKIPGLTNNAWTLHCIIIPANITEEKTRTLGKNVFIAEATWEIALQETRVV